MEQELDTIRQRMVAFLQGAGLRAVGAFPPEGRTQTTGTVIAVSLRSSTGGPAGFRDYLGERYNSATRQWEEVYGRRVELTFGLDLYAAPPDGAAELQRGVDTLCAALHLAQPAGLRVQALSWGETAFSREMGLFHCPAQARCQAYLYAVAQEGGTFLEFDVKGTRA